MFGSIALAALIFSGCGSSNKVKVIETEPMAMSIIHVNDTHSHLASESYSLSIDGVATKVALGGYPRMVSKIKALQGANENVLTLNAGDTFQGTLYYSLFKGEADADMMNQITWDALALGNHEFDDGDEALADYLASLNVENVLAANVEAEAGSVLDGAWKPYTIKTFANGEKVGIVGIDIKNKTEVSSNPSDAITFYDEVTTAQKYIDELTGLDINKIVLLTHVGLDNDIAYASQLRGVDVIIGGDSHSLIGDYSAIGLEPHMDTYPLEVQSKDGKKVCIGHAWQYAYAVGDMQVDFDKYGYVDSCAGNAVLVVGDTFTQKDGEGADAAVDGVTAAQIEATLAGLDMIEVVTEDVATAQILTNYSDQVDAQKSVVIGEASEYLGHARIPGTSDGQAVLPLGSDIAPIVAKSFYDLSNRADACIQNAGGVRISIEEGEVTMGTAYTLLPFANTLFEIEMYGSEVKQVLEDALVNYLDNGGSTGSFPYAYGLRYDINTSSEPYERISNLEIKSRQSGEWSAINPETMYVIVTNSYTGGGKDGYVTFGTVQDERGEGVDTYLDYALSFVRYVENLTAQGETLAKLPSEDHPIKSFQ
jgi:5'-nucleotidase